MKIDSSYPGYNKTYLKRETLYYLGLGYMKMRNLDTALMYYTEAFYMSPALDKDKESPMQVFSVLGIAMVYDMKGNHGEAVKYYDRVLNMEDIEDSHEAAKTYKEKGYK